MATHSSTRAWGTPWTEEPGGLQSVGSQRVGRAWVTHVHSPGVADARGTASPGARGRELFPEWLREGLRMPGPVRGWSRDTYRTQRAGSRHPSGLSGRPLSLSSQYVSLWIPVSESCIYSRSHRILQSLEKAELDQSPVLRKRVGVCVCLSLQLPNRSEEFKPTPSQPGRECCNLRPEYSREMLR